LNVQFHRFLIILLLIYSACRQESAPENQNPELRHVFSKHIAQKDSLFRTAIWSPIEAEERAGFKGLKYFPYDQQFRFTGPIVRYPTPDSVSIYATRAGDLRPAIRFGYVAFTYKGKAYRLEIFQLASKQNPGQTFLFLGFTDQTSGHETYGAGRYIDLKENPGDSCLIDFNYAYNPYCAYNERYSCALPPKENALPFAIKAGEKIYTP